MQKDKQISALKAELNNLKDKVCDLEPHIDSGTIERRDTVIVSGSAFPPENQSENPKSVVVSLIKENFKLIIKDDINVVHRSGLVNDRNTRPIIVKLHKRSLKYDLVGACVKLRPNIFVNERLTPKRRSISKQILAIRKGAKVPAVFHERREHHRETETLNSETHDHGQYVTYGRAA